MLNDFQFFFYTKIFLIYKKNVKNMKIHYFKLNLKIVININIFKCVPAL